MPRLAERKRKMRGYKKFINIIFFLFIFLVFKFDYLSAEENTSSQTSLSKEEEEINFLLTDRIKKGWDTKDIDLYMSAFSEKVSMQNVDGGKLMNYDEIKQQGEYFFENMVPVSYTISNEFIKINPDQNSAIIIYNVNLRYNYLGKEVNLQTGNILELIKENNEWKLIKSSPLKENKILSPLGNNAKLE